MDLGSKIRKYRETLGFTVKEVAEQANVTPSLISQVERNQANPSLATLKKIAEVLNTPLAYFFSEDTPVTPPVVRKHMRRKIVLGDGGIVEELLSPDLNGQIEFLFITINVDASGGGFVTHKGEECGLILEGTLELTLGTETYILEEGDSISFTSEIPHSLKNAGNKPLKMVWAITPPTF